MSNLFRLYLESGATMSVEPVGPYDTPSLFILTGGNRLALHAPDPWTTTARRIELAESLVAAATKFLAIERERSTRLDEMYEFTISPEPS